MRSIDGRNLARPLIGFGALALLAAGCQSFVAERSLGPAELPAEAGSARAEPETVAVEVEPQAQETFEPVPGARVFEAPAGWESLTNLAFERAVDQWLPAGEPRRVDDATLLDLKRALAGQDATAVRAAVMLGRSLDPRAGELLLLRLEEGVATPAGESQRDAADVVAAAAFASGMTAKKAVPRLNGLAIGRRQHPSLAVRVECARSTIALGRDDPIPYLLSVLRAGTTAGQVIGADAEEADFAWAQVRAAEALAARAGTKSRFLPEASIREREEEAARLEALLPPPRKR